MLKTYFLNSQKLPLVVESSSRNKSIELLSELAICRREFFSERLLQYGAVLLRGFKVRTIEEFERVARLFSGENFFNYAGGVSPRIALGSGVYTSTEFDARASQRAFVFGNLPAPFIFFLPHSAADRRRNDARRQPPNFAKYRTENCRFVQKQKNSLRP
jgi:hypothetical protein